MKISSTEEYDNLRKREPFEFDCTSCGKEASAKKVNDSQRQKTQRDLLCRNCRSKKTNIERYGVENPFQSEEIKKKIKQTCLEKYGCENPMQSEEVKEKSKQTCLEKYGAESALQNEMVKEKRKQTMLSLYGAAHALQCPDFLEKSKQTCLKNFGVEYPGQIEEVKEKAKRTCLEKYGCEHPMQSEEIKEKIRKTNLERYGTENPMHNSEILKKVSEKLSQVWKEKPQEEKEVIKKKFQETMHKKTSEERREIRRKANKRRKHTSIDGETFDSLWELKYYEYCKAKGFEIIREPVELEYLFNGKKHHYYPDFSVNGVLVEVKGPHLKNEKGFWVCPYKTPQNLEYANALYEAKHQCAVANNVQILYKEDLEGLGIL